jgi:signal transduction protein with GAF and PtsI domain
MSDKTIAGEILDIQNLVTTGKAVIAEVPGIDVHLVPLEQVLNNTKDLSARLQTRKGVKQDESKERRALLQQGHKLAGRVRAALKAHFGLDSERLVEFGARPIRPRKTPQTPTPTPTPTPTTPGSTPVAPTPVPAAKP